jgi:PBSX family phage terminase large subunit
MSLSFVLWAMNRSSGLNYGMAGKSIGTLRRNVIDTLKQCLKSRGYKVVDRRGADYLIVTKNGVRNLFYLFGGKDERSQDFVQGFTAAGFYFDEVVLMPESFVNQCMLRCSVDGSKLWFCCNPGSPFHWFKLDHFDKAEEKEYVTLHFELDDNPSLSEERKQAYRNNFTGIYYKRYILGLWVIADGIIYDSFDELVNTYTTDILPATLREDGKVTYGADYGTHNPQVFLESYIDKSGKLPVIYIDDEYYYDSRKKNKQKTDSEYVEDFKDFNNGKKMDVIVCDPSAASLIAALKKSGFNVKQANNEVSDGIGLVHTMLKLGLIKINKKKCPNLLKEIVTYSWDSKKAERGVEQPIKENDHAMDALRYIVRTCIKEYEIYPWLKDKKKEAKKEAA